MTLRDKLRIIIFEADTKAGRRFDVTDAKAEKADGIVCLGFKGLMSRKTLEALV